jgi:hypothetical protein
MAFCSRHGSAEKSLAAAGPKLHLLIESGVALDEPLLLLAQIVHRMDRVGSGDWHARPTIDATVGINIELRRRLERCFIFLGMDAICGASIDTNHILNAGSGNYEGHDVLSSIIAVVRSLQ